MARAAGRRSGPVRRRSEPGGPCHRVGRPLDDGPVGGDDAAGGPAGPDRERMYGTGRPSVGPTMSRSVRAAGMNSRSRTMAIDAILLAT
jgi:hypothetical protein